MKKSIISAVLFAAILAALTGCAKKEAVKPTMEDIYTANGYESLKAKHTSMLEWYELSREGVITTGQEYFDKDSSATLDSTEGESQTYFYYYADHSTAGVITDGAAQELRNYATVKKGVEFSREQTYNLFKKPDNGGEELESCEKTEKGWSAVVIQKEAENVEKYATGYIGRSRQDGEYLKYDLELNEAYEITALKLSYMTADKAEPITFYQASTQFDLSAPPEFYTEGKAALESGEHHTVTLICEGKEIDQQTAYGPNYILLTNYQVYEDAEGTVAIEANTVGAERSRYVFELNGDLTIYMK